VLTLQKPLHGQLHGQGTSRREDRSLIETAQLSRQKGSQSHAQEERKESCRIRALGRLPQLPGRERRSGRGWIR
jgi:hypothetical protein